ncbi:hypothetical protein COO60DRAFT_1551304 [Scenedesmus sp. NREL 46B-D3]|nr:hypothetical protein COO60DRAFT_1551304 [Scenedesmus sp. NREL 46B-D3]
MELFRRGTVALAAVRRTQAQLEDERKAAAAEDRPQRRRLDPAAAAAAAGGVAFDPPVSPQVGRRSATQDLFAPAPVSAAESALQARLDQMTSTMAEGLAMLANKVDAQAAAPVMPANKDPGLKAKVAMWQEMAAIVQENPGLSDGVLAKRALTVVYNRGHVTGRGGVGLAGYGGAAMPGMGPGMMPPGMAGFGMQPGMGMYGMPPGGLPAGMGGYGMALSMMAAGMPAGAAAVMPGMSMAMMPGMGMSVAPGMALGVGTPQWGWGWGPARDDGSRSPAAGYGRG